MSSDDDRRLQLLPGCQCDQCGRAAISRGTRHRNRNGDLLQTPLRRFYCPHCKLNFKRPLANLAAPNPLAP